MRRASSLFIAALTAVLTTVVTMITPAAAASGPSAHVDTRGRGVCVDTSLRLTFGQPPTLGTAMDSHINPAGWRLDNAGCDQAPHVFYAEYGNTDLTGKPIDTSARLACSRRLTSAEAARWSEPAFVLGSWVPRRFR